MTRKSSYRLKYSDDDLLKGGRMVKRWNVCQRIGAEIYRSTLSDSEVDVFRQQIKAGLPK